MDIIRGADSGATCASDVREGHAMQTTTYAETPGTDDRPEELPENERPEEMPPIDDRPQTPQEMPEIEPGSVQPGEGAPGLEPESPEIGNPAPGPGPDQGAGEVDSVLRVAEDDLVAAHPRRIVGAWRQTLRRRDRHGRARRVPTPVV